MKPHRLHAVLCAVAMAGTLAAFDATAQKADAMRPEIGTPLQAAQNLSKAGKHREALAKVNEADAVPAKTANESFLVQRMRGSVAAAAGDNDTAIKSYEAVLNSGRLAGRDQQQMIQAVAGGNYKNKDYAKAAQWTQRYFKEGGTDPAMRTMLLQSYYLGNDRASVNKMLGSAASEDNGRKASEEELQILANCYLKQRDTGGYVAAIEKLVVFYPKKEYWTDLLALVQK